MLPAAIVAVDHVRGEGRRKVYRSTFDARNQLERQVGSEECGRGRAVQAVHEMTDMQPLAIVEEDGTRHDAEFWDQVLADDDLRDEEGVVGVTLSADDIKITPLGGVRPRNMNDCTQRSRSIYHHKEQTTRMAKHPRPKSRGERGHMPVQKGWILTPPRGGKPLKATLLSKFRTQGNRFTTFRIDEKVAGEFKEIPRAN